jgi:hypothetical protein
MGFLDGVLGGVVGAEALSLVKGYFESTVVSTAS